jgi:hypothetical protein
MPVKATKMELYLTFTCPRILINSNYNVALPAFFSPTVKSFCEDLRRKRLESPAEAACQKFISLKITKDVFPEWL